MITTILSILLFIIFFVLGLIHFNWVFGGKWGFEKAVPTKENGERVLNPKKFDSAIVGFGLILFGLVYFLKSGLVNFQIPNWIFIYGIWIIPSIFILRAIGDFKYVGFFKKIKNTEFAKADSKFFSPLCLTIGLIGIVIQLMK
jgi:hypothetical protein